MATGKIHSIETFGTVDGPGVRFVVFFQGCPMRCLYCHNPDTWAFGAGTEFTAQQLLDRMIRNISFYKTGGITATGGEPLMQIEFLCELFESAKANGIHTCLDTSGIMFDPDDKKRMKLFDRLIKSTDLVMLDIKHIDEQKHEKLTGHSGRNILAFAQYLDKMQVPLRIRHVLVPGFTDDKAALEMLGKFLKGFRNIEKIEVLPYHSMGRVKYENLGIGYPLGDTPQLSESDAKNALAIIESARNAQ